MLTTGKKVVTIFASFLAGIFAESINVIIILDFITFFISFLLTSFIQLKNDVVLENNTKSDFSVAEVITYIRKNNALKKFFFVIIILVSTSVAVTLSFPEFASKVYHLDNDGFGLLKSIYNCSGIIVLIILPYMEDIVKRFDVVVFLAGIFIIGYGSNTFLLLALLCIVLYGIMSCVFDIAFPPILQEIFPEEMMGRLFGLVTIMSLLMGALGELVLGMLIDYAGVKIILMIIGVIFIISSLRLIKIQVAINSTKLQLEKIK